MAKFQGIQMPLFSNFCFGLMSQVSAILFAPFSLSKPLCDLYCKFRIWLPTSLGLIILQYQRNSQQFQIMLRLQDLMIKMVKFPIWYSAWAVLKYCAQKSWTHIADFFSLKKIFWVNQSFHLPCWSKYSFTVPNQSSLWYLLFSYICSMTEACLPHYLQMQINPLLFSMI